jgi:hypothetical protein
VSRATFLPAPSSSLAGPRPQSGNGHSIEGCPPGEMHHAASGSCIVITGRRLPSPFRICELLVLEWDYPPQKARERNKENSRAWFSTDRVPCHVPATVDDKAYQVGSPIRPTEGPLPRTAVTFPSGGPCAKSCRSRCRDAVTQVTHYSHVPARQSSAPLAIWQIPLAVDPRLLP